MSYLLVKYVVSNVITSPKKSYTTLLRALAQKTFRNHIYHIIEAIILLLHSSEVITKCLSTSFTKMEFSCLVNIIPAISLSKGNILKSPHFQQLMN